MKLNMTEVKALTSKICNDLTQESNIQIKAIEKTYHSNEVVKRVMELQEKYRALSQEIEKIKEKQNVIDDLLFKTFSKFNCSTYDKSSESSLRNFINCVMRKDGAYPTFPNREDIQNSIIIKAIDSVDVNEIINLIKKEYATNN